MHYINQITLKQIYQKRILYLKQLSFNISGGDKMHIKVLIDDKKGATTLLDRHFGLLKHLINRYPNALWKKIKGKNGEIGYELEV